MSGRIYCFEVTGQLEYFTDDLLKALREWADKNNYNCATIIHDKDTKYNEETKETESVKVHRHFIVNTKTSRWSFQMLLQRFSSLGLTSQMLQNIRKGWNNAQSYLCHRTNGAVKEGKHVYSPEEVDANYDYVRTLEVIDSEVEEKKTRIDEVIEAIKNGECRRYNITEYISMEDYTKKGNKQKIDLAFQYKETQLRNDRKERSMDVYWIYGKPGIGKTTLAKMLCNISKWSYAVSSSSNDPLQDYEGQDALILDDFRPNHWSKSDVLKMLDNNTISSIKARYQNKQTCYLQSVIITSVLSPMELWNSDGWERGTSEPYEQLSRRVRLLVEMYKNEDDGHVYYTVKHYKSNGDVTVQKYDFTEQFADMMEKEKKDDEPLVFSKLKHEKKIEKQDLRLKLDTEGKFVTEKDVPF